MADPINTVLSFEEECTIEVGKLRFNLRGEDGKLLLFRLKELLADKPEPIGLDPRMLSGALQAIDMFEVITTSQPQDYQSLEILRSEYVNIGNFRKALETSFKIATAYENLGMLNAAKVVYRSILDVFPGHQKAWEGFDKLNAPAEVFLESPEIIGEAPVSPRKPFELTPEERAQLERTIEALEDLRILHPNDPQNFEILKESYHKLGNEEKAMYARGRLAEIYFKEGNLVDARLECEAILSKDPADEEARLIMASIEKHLQPPPE